MAPPNAPWVAEPSTTDAPFLQSTLTGGDTPNLNAGVSGTSVVDRVLQDAAPRPFSDLKDALPIPTSSSADPVKDVLDSAQHIAEFPFRLSQTMSALSGPADEAVKTHLESMGLHPAIAWALGKAAGLVVDPRNIVMFGEGGVPNLEGKDFPKFGNVGGEATVKRAAQAEAMGVNLSPAEASQTKILNVLEDLGNIYPYTGDDFQNFYKTRLEQADNIRASLVNKVGNNAATKEVADIMKKQIQDYLQKATPEQASYLQDKFGDLDAYMKKPAAGQFTQSMLAQNRKLLLDAAGGQFDMVDSVVPGQHPMETESFAIKSKELLKKEMNAKVSDRNPAWVKRLADYAGVDTNALPTLADGTPMVGPLYEAIQKELEKQGQASATKMSYGATQATMRKLRDLRISNDPGYLSNIPGQGNTYSGYAAQLRKALHQDIELGLTKLSDQAKELLDKNPPIDDSAAMADLNKMTQAPEIYKAAKVNYAQTKELTNDPFIIKLMKNDPEDFLDHAVKSQDITNIAKLKEILGPDNFVPVKQNLLANMLVDKEGVINPQSFVKKIEKIGFPTLTKVFDPQELYEIAQTQEVFTNMKRGFTEGSQTGGRLMAKAALFGVPAEAYHQIMSGRIDKAIGTVVGATGVPKALAKMYLSKTGRDLLIHGIAVPDSAAKTLSLLSKGAMMSATENARASAGK